MDPPSSPSSVTSSRRQAAIITWDDKNKEAHRLLGLEQANPRTTIATTAELARRAIWNISKAEWNGMQGVRVPINYGSVESPRMKNPRIAKYLYSTIKPTVEGVSSFWFSPAFSERDSKFLHVSTDLHNRTPRRCR